ncbi:hypothetical protein MMC21_002266 [Puttea exsequens]|nr:hypothetical protein [Puttea exsequens]
MASHSFFDDVFEDSSRLSLRIPPLHNPLPELSTTFRPPTLEPNARVNDHNETSKLTGRRKALAQAKSLDAADPKDWEGVSVPKISNGSESQELDPLEDRPRKRAKVADFVQLPKPLTKSKEEKLPPFRPIAVLNELHEPPPSAALFPPITPSAGHDEHHSQHARRVFMESASDGTSESGRATKTKQRSKNVERAPKTYIRARMKWTDVESKQLVKGVAIYGMGRWKAILEHPEFIFQEGRTGPDLKDRFRTLFPRKVPQKHAMCQEYEKNVQGKAAMSEVDSPPRQLLRARKRHWSEVEDAELDKAFRKYGFQWNLMVKDPDFHFNGRSNNQVRDRFRLRYPELYNEQNATSPAKQPPDKKAPAKKPSQLKENQEANPKPAPTRTKHSAVDAFIKSDDVVAKPSMPSLSASFNDDEDHRLPNSILRDDWNFDDNLTLAPLAWEDIANQPMFPFD